MTKSETGRLGGLTAFQRHGRTHMQAIGRRGFARFATFARGRQRALEKLASKGRIQPFHPINRDRSGRGLRSLG